jgi:hypothetical protein
MPLWLQPCDCVPRSVVPRSMIDTLHPLAVPGGQLRATVMHGVCVHVPQKQTPRREPPGMLACLVLRGDRPRLHVLCLEYRTRMHEDEEILEMQEP